MQLNCLRRSLSLFLSLSIEEYLIFSSNALYLFNCQMALSVNVIIKLSFALLYYICKGNSHTLTLSLFQLLNMFFLLFTFPAKILFMKPNFYLVYIFLCYLFCIIISFSCLNNISAF